MKNIFEDFKKSEKSKLLKALEATNIALKKGSNFLSQTKNKNFIAFIEKGSIDVIDTDYNGSIRVVESFEENDIFGSKISIFNDNYEAIAKEDSEIILIDYNRLFNDDNKAYYIIKFKHNLLEKITSVAEEKAKRIEILSKKSIRNKLLTFFEISRKTTGSRNIYLKSTLTDLANYLAIDRCAMMRELKYLKEEGFIEIKNKVIKLLY